MCRQGVPRHEMARESVPQFAAPLVLHRGVWALPPDTFQRANAWPLPRKLPRRVRSLIRRQAAGAARLAAARVDAVHRERLAATATDLLAAGRPLADVLAELAGAD